MEICEAADISNWDSEEIVMVKWNDPPPLNLNTCISFQYWNIQFANIENKKKGKTKQSNKSNGIFLSTVSLTS